ncbi:MAG: type II toxin-antitoxin system VapC family toxin [Deltaproteobacteria bacterium]|nr:type II toxin-antitoxin system VapC family toxin [Deltaproteobacteria bacterium]
MRLYLDTSALAKRYIQEPGSREVIERSRLASQVIVSSLCVPELISALCRLGRERKLSNKDYEDIKVDLANDLSAATVVEPDTAVIRQAIRCMEAEPLRTLDAIQIASALEAGCDLFLSSDRQQCRSAKLLNLAVEQVGFTRR